METQGTPLTRTQRVECDGELGRERETSLSWVRYNPGHSIKATKGCNGCEMGSNGVRHWMMVVAVGCPLLPTHDVYSVSYNNINTEGCFNPSVGDREGSKD